MAEKRWIGHETRLLCNLIRRHMDAGAADTRYGDMTSVQMWVIGYLHRMERQGLDAYQRDVEKEFGVRRSTATGVLQGLERRGLITRSAVERDGRLKRLALTDEARALHQDAVSAISALEALMCAGISDQDIDICVSVLRRMRANIERAECAQAAGASHAASTSDKGDTGSL